MIVCKMIAILLGAYSLCQLHLVAAVSSPCNYPAQRCGDLSIPYPFSMSSECGLPDLYRISCKLNASYGTGEIPFLQFGAGASPAELQVLAFSNSSNTIIVNSTELKAMPSPAGCHGRGEDGVAVLDLSSSGPFALSDGNMFAVIGCNSTGSCLGPPKKGSKPFSIKCESGCYNEFDFTFCNDYACCSSSIPPGSRHLSFTGNGVAYADFPGLCGFSTVLTPSTYDDVGRPGIFAAGHYGMSMAWALQIVANSDNCSACADHASCVPDKFVPGYTCSCSNHGFQGDGYTHGTGCEDIDECTEGSDDCDSAHGICTNTVGSFNCSCAKGYAGSGLKSSCVAENTIKDLVLQTAFGSLGGAAVIALLIIIVFLARKTCKQKQAREENFHRNGGEELRAILYSEDQLKKITHNFSRKRELGKGGYSTVYWGILPDKGKVAIKKAKNMDNEEKEEDQMKSFVSEILLLGTTTHENIVQLLGCCVETRVPLLVYEFIEYGNLWEHLHPAPSRSEQNSLLRGSWARRLQIAVGTARALSHLHKTNPPILHRDIKSMNILIDRFYNPKVADFGASRFLTSGAAHLTFNLVVGTHGYLDPEYHRSFKFTTKSDVYSFGVVLLELITAMPPDLGTTFGLLAHHFQSQFRINSHTELIDSKLGSDSGVLASIEDVAELAMECVAVEGNQRPTMEEVLHRLMSSQSKAGPASLKSNYMHLQERVVISAGDIEECALLGSYPLASTSSTSASTTREIGLISF